MNIDAITLLIMSLIMTSVLSSLWFISAFVFKAYPRISWHFGLTNLFLGLFMLFYALREVWPHVETYVLADLSFLLGFMFMRRSTQELTRVSKTDKEQLTFIFLTLFIEVPTKWIKLENTLTAISICIFAIYTLYYTVKDTYHYIVKDFGTKYSIMILLPIYSIAILIFTRIMILLFLPSANLDLREGTFFDILFIIGMILSIIGINAVAVGLVMSNLISKIKRLSQEDPLTNAFNRRHLDSIGKEEIEKNKKTGNTLSIIMLDIDHFKKINDVYGHSAGDVALIKCVEVIQHTVRTNDYVGRLGGEEFCVILPNTSLETTTSIAERIRHNLEKEDIIFNNNKINITASLGVCSLNEKIENEWSHLLNKADQAMYEAKNNGRNKVVTRK